MTRNRNNGSPDLGAGARHAPPTVWVAGLVGGALGCAATAALLLAVAPFGGPGAAGPLAAGRAAAPSGPASASAESLDAASARLAAADESVETLDAALARAEAERSQLARTVLDLSRELDALTIEVEASLAAIEAASRADDAAPGEAPGEASIDEIELEPFAGETGRPERERGGANSLERLVAAGLDAASAAEIDRRDNAWQLARLELIDRAAREGRTGGEALDRELEALEQTRPDIREELGDAAYDRYLYEGGGPNRVTIAEIIPGSAAAEAGLQAGDLLLGYAGERMFRIGELQDATRAGQRGESVFVDAERDGQSISVQLPRGPLGVTLSPTRREP